LVGYGKGGRTFHAPYIEAADAVDLAGVVTRDPGRRAELAHDFPGVPAYASLTDLLDAGVEAVAITTPPSTRRELVLEAIDRGIPVVADKPFAPTATAGQDLVDAAAAAGVPIAVFHNRRWDTDIRSLREVLNSGDLGQPQRIESRFDRDSHNVDPGPDGGVLRDLGTHLVDQMIWLFGQVAQVYAALDWIDLPEGRTDAGFTVTMRHAAGPVSTVTASKTRHAAGRELRVYAEHGSYHSAMTDVQTEALSNGRRPVDVGDAWGLEAEERWGTLSTSAGVRRVPSARGAYQDYYTQFAQAVAGKAELPVTGAEAIRTLEVLDAARRSDETRQAITL
jgi:predicted dehydrogenase